MKSGTRELQNNIYDLIGVGVGPFNLGLAALLDRVNGVTSLFLDKKESFSWHEDMTLNNSKLQVHYLKDLVTLVDPTSQFSFLSYLAEQGRIFQFIHRKEQSIAREEFNHYFKWVSKKLKTIKFDENVLSSYYDGEKFIIETKNQTYLAKNIVIGTGTSPHILKIFEDSLCRTVFHNSTYKSSISTLDFSGKKIAIIGGGQSGAEVLDDILSLNNLPQEIAWISERVNFHPLENACFSNEFYSPSYTKYFYELPFETRVKKLNAQILTSDGISEDLADIIYNKIYELKFVKKSNAKFHLLLNHSVRSIENTTSGHNLSILNLDTGRDLQKNFDIVILATGYQYVVPQVLKSIFPEISSLDNLEINSDYSIKWANSQNKIFIQNGAKHQFGIADPNLSLSTWRNATIINSLLNKDVYNLNLDSPIINHQLI